MTPGRASMLVSICCPKVACGSNAAPDVPSSRCPLNSQRLPPGLLQPLLRPPIALAPVITFGERQYALPAEVPPAWWVLGRSRPADSPSPVLLLGVLRKTRASTSVSFPARSLSQSHSPNWFGRFIEEMNCYRESSKSAA